MADQQSPSKAPGDDYIQSLARGLDVIKTFNAQRPHQTLSEVAAAAGLTRAGARRILLTLVHLGFALHDGRYFSLTPRILDLGYAYLSSMALWDVAEPIVEALVQAAKESSSIAVLDGTDIVYVLRVPTRKIMAVNLSIGSRLPAALTSMGRVLLSDLTPAALEAHLDAFLAHPHPAALPYDRDSLRASIDTVRRQGWSLVHQELEAGLVSIAAPIHDRNGRIVAAINISGIAKDDASVDSIKSLLPELQNTAASISRHLARRI
ncbi:MAG: IclR family transcriptional regulator C-terminal domain-containing protein [Rhodocyclaceae bacterium]